MGNETGDILCSFQLSEVNSKNYDTFKATFDEHFVKRKNVIYEQAKSSDDKNLVSLWIHL